MAIDSAIFTFALALALSTVLVQSANSNVFFHHPQTRCALPPCSSYQPIYGGL